MTKRRIDFRHVLLGCFSFVMVATLAFFLAKNIFHSNAESFNPGNIISDAAMRDYRSLSESDIQNFLKSKNSCDDRNLSKTGNNVNYLSENSPYSWHVKDGHYVCMADETFNGGTAAHIIYQAAQDYHINPKVLIVLLEKEQSLVRDTFPNSVQYRSATGFGCPDTAACDSKYYGLNNQIRNAASMFNDVLNGGWTNYPVGNNYIQYNPNSNCGGSNVYIQNLATSALYRYTPYQPGGDASKNCAAYGNINFYNFYTNWFGSTQQVFSASDLNNIYLPDGTYGLLSMSGMAMDVANASKNNGANIQIYNNNGSNSQQFKITRGSDGFYTIASVISGKVLEVQSGSVLPGANIQLYNNNGTCAQKWAISYDSESHYIIRNACSGHALDIAGGTISKSGTNVQIYSNNKSLAQSWNLVSLDMASIQDGTYKLVNNRGLALDVKDYGTSNGTNVQIYYNSDNAAQDFEIIRNKDGYYNIKNPNSNKLLDVKDASSNSGANIQLWSDNGSCAQKWVITKVGDNYTIRNACSGNALDMQGGRMSTAGTNIQSFFYNNTPAQYWNISSVKSSQFVGGTYTILTPSGLSLDIDGARKDNGTNVKIYTSHNSPAQYYTFQKTNDGYLKIINPNSDKALDVTMAATWSGANIQIYNKASNSCAQKWFILSLGSNYAIRNACSGNALDVSGGKINTPNTNVQSYAYNSSKAQEWQISKQ